MFSEGRRLDRRIEDVRVETCAALFAPRTGYSCAGHLLSVQEGGPLEDKGGKQR